MQHPGQIIEVKILELVRNREFFSKLDKIIEPEFFANASTRTVYDQIGRYFDKGSHKKINYSDLLSFIRVRIQDDDLVGECRTVLSRMRKISNKIDSPVIIGIAVEWAKRSLVKQALYEGLEQLENSEGMDLDSIREQFDQAANIGVENEASYHYFKQTDKRLEDNIFIAPVAMGLAEIDHMLEGGLDVGELGIFIGPTHRGKTRSLINIGVNALKLGKVVAHVIVCDSSVKRIARRYDSTIANRMYTVLKDRPKILLRKMAKIWRKGGRLVLKEFDKHAPSPIDLRHWIRGYQETHDRKIDLLILDYIDEMRGDKRYQDIRHESRDVTAGVRRLGAEFGFPIWSASQGNRKALEKALVGIADIAEDIWKANRADIIITLNQTDEEKEENAMRYRIVKARGREAFSAKIIHLDVSDAGYITEQSFGGMK